MSPKFKSIDEHEESTNGSSAGKVLGITVLVLSLTLIVAAIFFVYKKKLINRKFNVRLHFKNSSVFNSDDSNVKISISQQRAKNSNNHNNHKHNNEIFMDSNDSVTVRNILQLYPWKY